jgi:hypothetical protein
MNLRIRQVPTKAIPIDNGFRNNDQLGLGGTPTEKKTFVLDLRCNSRPRSQAKD